MIWERFFATRLAIVLYYSFVSMVWLILSVLELFNIFGESLLLGRILLFLHSMGMIGLSAGFFGQRHWALMVTFVLGLLWFTAASYLVIAGEYIRQLSELSLDELLAMAMILTSGFALFFLTWLLMRNTRSSCDHFGEC